MMPGSSLGIWHLALGTSHFRTDHQLAPTQSGTID